jgi:hypothetical protein
MRFGKQTRRLIRLTSNEIRRDRPDSPSLLSRDLMRLCRKVGQFANPHPKSPNLVLVSLQTHDVLFL